MSDLIKCNICGGYHPWRVVKDAQRSVGPWEDYCTIYTYFEVDDGWRSFRHVDLYSDEISQEVTIENAWESLLMKLRREAAFGKEYDIVCPTCHSKFISGFNMPGECPSCTMRGEELR